MIGGNVPKHLVSGARTGFLVALKAFPADWKKVAMTANLEGASMDVVDLGAAPMPTESKSGFTVQDMIEKHIEVKPTDWDITVWISQNAIDDDRTASLFRRVKQAGANFNRHLNDRVFTVLNGGDGTTYGLCYDGQQFFDSDHVDAGAHYQTDQDNEYDLALSSDNFETVWVAAQDIRDDQGECAGFKYDLIVCHPSGRREAHQICKNEWYDWSTGNREKNPWLNELNYITTPKFDTSAWVLVASGEQIKPMIVAMREQPHLQHAWFDPNAPDGGRHYFKFFARYEVYYGEWRLAIMGDS